MPTAQAQYSGSSKSNIRTTIRLKASVKLMLKQLYVEKLQRNWTKLMLA